MMISIKECIKQIVSENQFLEDALYNEYLNLSSFAVFISPRVKQMTKKEVTIGSIKIALSRISKEQQERIQYKIIKPDNIFVRKNINLLSISNPNNPEELYSKLYSVNKGTSKSYFGIIQGLSETDIIYSHDLEKLVEASVGKKSIKVKKTQLGAIGVNINEELFNTKGVIYNLIKKLTFYNINIFAISSTYTEIVFVIDEVDIKKAFDVFIA